METFKQLTTAIKASSLFIFAIIFSINLMAWAWLNQAEDEIPWQGTIQGLSFNPFRVEHNPDKGVFPAPRQIDQDLALLESRAHAVRTYSVTNGQELIPDLAKEHGLNVAAGAWIGTDEALNQQEIDSLIKIDSRAQNNVVRLLVGNEALLRQDVQVDQMIDYLRQVKKQVWRPVSTAEPWHVWLDHPELAEEVDYIAAHILPYWEGIDVDQAVDYVFKRHAQLRNAFPNKPVVLMEVGWPSAGPVIKDAEPSLFNQAKFLRIFLNRAHEEKIIYYVVEAFDQPWKMQREGSVGAYWGMFNADREEKFPLQGAIEKMPEWKKWALFAGGLSLLPALFFFRQRKTIKVPGKLFFITMVNLAASAMVWTISTGFSLYQSPITAAVWTLLVIMQGFALLILMIESLDVSEILWQAKSGRRFKPEDPATAFSFPKVSIHVPIHNEPPEMVMQTLNALACLDYPDFEILVLDNNTQDPAVWMPVQTHCQRLGDRFRFFHLENWPGYKAGALNFGLKQTATDAEVIGVIDSDYIVTTDWLKRMMPHFTRPEVGFVQAPQDYSDADESIFKSMCFWEYAGFFKIGMVQRNDANAIIQHGTMTLMRKAALREAGAWGEWCICEDAELGLRLFRDGYDSVYVNHSFGKGVMPDTLSAFKSQRYRWVYGAMQIMKHHWRELFTSTKSGLTPAQRYHFVAGWIPWIADGLSLVFTFASLFLSIYALHYSAQVEFPVTAFLLPVIGLFAFKVIRAFWLYAVKVKCSPLKTLGAAIAGLSLAHTVAKAVWAGVLTRKMPFLRTPKMERGRFLLSGLSMIREEIGILGLLLTSAFMISRIESFQNTTGQLWVVILIIQSIPYLASLIMALLNIASNWRMEKFAVMNDDPSTMLSR